MTVKKLDHVVVVVEDLATMTGFFKGLGLKIVGEATVDGAWLDAVYGPGGIDADIVMMATPDGLGRVELAQYRQPQPMTVQPRPAPPSAVGLRRITFEVTGLNEVLTRLGEVGGNLIGDVAEDVGRLRLCYVRGPEGIIITLAERF